RLAYFGVTSFLASAIILFTTQNLSIWKGVGMALVLCTGSDPVLMETRRLILERAGHTVVPVLDEHALVAACEQHKFDVAVIGQNVSPKLKRRVLTLVRKYCPSVRVLELHHNYTSRALDNADSWLEVPTDTPGELAD